MKYLKLTFAALLLILTACTNKEQNDYEKVMESTDLTLVETYLETYKEAPIEHIGAVKKRLADLTKDSIMYAAVKEQPVIELRYNAALDYVMNLPDGIHVDEVNEIIARDSAEAEEILEQRAAARAAAVAQAEYEENYGTIRNIVENAWFRHDQYNYVILSVPNEEGKGYGMASSSNKYVMNPTKIFDYTVKPGSNDIIAHLLNTGNDLLVTISVYSDCIYMQYAGSSVYYQRNPVSEEEYKESEKMLINSIREYEDNKKNKN